MPCLLSTSPGPISFGDLKNYFDVQGCLGYYTTRKKTLVKLLVIFLPEGVLSCLTDVKTGGALRAQEVLTLFGGDAILWEDGKNKFGSMFKTL